MAPSPRVRRVSRVIREIDPITTLKVGAAFHLVAYVTALVALVLLWSVASATGTIDNIESFLESFGWETFVFNGRQLFVNVMFFGLFLAALGTILWVLGAVVFNLIADLVGGVRVTVLEEEVTSTSVEGDKKRR
jgi:hypothetical protein